MGNTYTEFVMVDHLQTCTTLRLTSFPQVFQEGPDFVGKRYVVGSASSIDKNALICGYRQRNDTHV